MRFLLVSLQALGISSPHLLSLDLSKDPLLLSLMEMYGEMGDKIALQYGGSEAHKKVFAGKSVQTHSSSKQSELLTSIKRYYRLVMFGTQYFCLVLFLLLAMPSLTW